MLQWISIIKNRKIKATIRPLFLLMVFFVFGLFSLLLVRGVEAQTPITATGLGLNSNVQQSLGLAATDIRVIIAKIIRAAFALLGLVFLVIVLYGGFLWMTAGGNEEKISSAKRLFFNGVIGLVIMLSAVGITQFIMHLLGLDAAGAPGSGTTVGAPPGGTNFTGSGTLGTVIKDHYPARGQIDVPRNVKIIITFRPAVTTTSFIVDTNGDGIYGDCKNIGLPAFNWESDCDQLKSGTDLIDVKQSDTGAAIRGANALVNYEGGKAYTVVIRPFDYLGSDIAKVGYTVRIGKGVLRDDPANNNPSIFDGFPSGRDFYTWNFTCSTNLDVTPPHVTSVFPSVSSTEVKNTTIQINFDKPMDPSVLQGSFADGDASAYALTGNAIFLKKSGNSTMPQGAFRLVNNYQTLEFTPTEVCGENACGGKVYCLPVCDVAGKACSTDNNEILLRAGKTFTNTSFEAVPLSGVMDVSGNALDGNGDNKVNIAPTTTPVFPNQEPPDNYHWSFSLSNQLDLTPPFIRTTTPGIDATFVAPNDELSMTFSKRMLFDSLYNIDVTSTEAICKVPRATNNADGSTYVNMVHCPFSASDAASYYYPIVDSNVVDAHFNCMYPGKGPNALDQTNGSSVVCDSANPTNCCAVDNTTNPFCCNGLPSADSRDTCLSKLKL